MALPAPSTRRRRDALVFYRPRWETTYQHIGPLFADAIDRGRIETHRHDLLQVLRSIQAGKVVPSMSLRKLTSYSRKNSRYQAFPNLGRVVGMLIPLKYLSDPMRQAVTATTNKQEACNGFSKWVSFGGQALSAANTGRQEKQVKYADLVANPAILQNTIDLAQAVSALAAGGYEIKREELRQLSPHWTSYIKRFGDDVRDWADLPPPRPADLPLPV